MESKISKPIFCINSRSLHKYNRKGVYFGKPLLVALYDYNHGKVSDAKRMKYFQNIESNRYPLDLNLDDVDQYIPGEECMGYRNFALTLKYMMKTGAVISDVKNIDKTKVITSRQTLVGIMASAYYNVFSYFKINVSRYNCNLYMLLVSEGESLYEVTPIHTHYRRLDKLLFSGSPKTPSKFDEPYDDNIGLVGVHCSNFGKYEVIYSGIVQGIISEKTIEKFDDFDALNKCRYVLGKQMLKRNKNKDMIYLKYWVQAYLGNVRDIYVAYKDKEGIVNEPIKHTFSNDLPKNRFWKPSVLNGFLYEFLQNVEKQMSSVNDLCTVYSFQYKENSFYCEVFEGKNDKTFVTKEYMEYCEII